MPTISKINNVITYNVPIFECLFCSSNLKNVAKYVIDNISEVCAC